MSVSLPKKLSIFAPAKLNLFLHITGKRRDGYHMLDSLVSFVDVGDVVHIERAEHFSFALSGAFAPKLRHEQERRGYSDDDNLVVKAAKRLAEITGKPLNVRITLEKNLPAAAGIGGGSSDAAATVWGLQKFWHLAHDADYLMPMLSHLGADVSVCFACEARVMRGIGDVLLPAIDMPDIPVLLVNPNISCATADVFLHYKNAFRASVCVPQHITCVSMLVKILEQTHNDLYAPALSLIPELDNVMSAIKTQSGALITRMSGSGATCFGLFETQKACESAAAVIAHDNPDWWVKTGFLNRVQRY